MIAQLKYGSQEVFWDTRKKEVITYYAAQKYRVRGRLKLPNHIERFPSVLEFNVYQKLVDLYGERRIVRQYPLVIMPPGCCYPKGKKWRVDFAIQWLPNSKDFVLFVEAKGALIAEFRHTLSALEAYDNAAFNKLRIIWGSGIPKHGVFIRNLLASEFRNQMYSFRQFENMSRLP